MRHAEKEIIAET